jgi:hypothetical protein
VGGSWVWAVTAAAAAATEVQKASVASLGARKSARSHWDFKQGGLTQLRVAASLLGPEFAHQRL